MIGCVVMAAGAARRFDGNKLLASLGDALVVERTIRSVPAAYECVVVTRWPEVAEVARSCQVSCVAPEGPQRSDSVRAGLGFGAERWIGCAFLSGDQPLVRPESLSALAARFLVHPDRPVRLAYGGVPAAPVLFPRRLFPKLMDLRGRAGGREVLEGESIELVEAQSARELFDIDTRGDLRRVRAHLDPACGEEG